LPKYIDHAIYNLNTLGLIQARGIAAPLQVFQLLIDTLNRPYIAFKSNNGGPVILEESDIHYAYIAFPGIGNRQRQPIDHIGRGIRSKLSPSSYGLFPIGGSSI